MSENLLEETKQIVKSLVIPHPRGVGLRFLCDEYQEMEGKQLPYRELGYKSLTHFLNSIPDVVKMYGHLEDPGSVTLFPVADESTAHIVEMVAHQSKNKRGKKKSPRNAFPFRTNPRPRITYATQSTYNPNPYYSQRITNSRSTTNPKSLSSSWNAVRANYLNKSANKTNSNVFNFRSNESNTWQNFTVRDIDNPNVMAASHNKSVKSNSNPNLNVISRPTAQHSSGHEVLRSSQSPFVTTQVKENLMKMMTSRDMDDGIMLFNFDARYKHQFNESLDWKKFGFSSLVECLKSVPQLINLIPTGTNTFKLMPSKFVNHEPTFTKHSSQLPTTTTVLTNGHSMAVITTTATSTTVTFVTTSLNTMTTTSITTQNSATHNNMRPICSPSPSHSSGVSSEPSTRSNSPTSHIDLNKKAIENFRHILCLFDKGIPATQFPHEYEKVFKVRFDSRIWGFPTPMELFHRLPEIFAIQEKDDTSDPLLHDSRFKKFERPKHVPKMNPTDLCYLSKIPDLVQSRIMKLIDLNMPSGLPLPYFCEEYKMNYGEIDLSQMRITDTSHLFNVLQSGLPIIVKMVDGNNRAFLKSEKDVDNWIGECTRTYRYIVPKTMVNVPPNVVLPGDQMRPITLPKGVEVGNGEYVAVYISSAVSPSDIYIQFRGPDYHTALEEQMKKLDIYECLDEDVWRVPKQFLCLGLPVVARFQGDRYWNRARVIKIHDETRESRVVTVSFVDYGGILVTDYKDLRLMKREFLGLPMQALRVSLYGIKPILGAEGWTAAARDKVLRFSKRNYGIACTFMEDKNGVYMVCLCDTNSSSDIFIHNVLVNDGHALFEENVLDLLADEVNGQNTIDSTNNFALDSTIDVTDNLSQLPAPLTPSRATTITPKQDANLVPNEVSNKVQIQSNSLLQSIPQIEESDDRNETPCHESKSVNNSFMSQSLSIEQLREVAQKVISEESKTASRTKKLTPKITISSNVHKGETLITNENGISARNLSKLSQLELTPNNSGSDTESVGDLKEKKLPNYSKEDILEAKAKIISVKNKYVHLIYYKQEFYFTYEGVHEIFNGTELWQLIGFSGGYIKGRIQLIEEEGIALFSHLDVKYRTDKRLIFLYPEESVVEFTSLSGDTEVRVAIKKSVKQFAEDIAKAETAKLQRVMSSLNRKVKNIKV